MRGRRGVSELTAAIMLILITVVAAAIILHGWMIYSSKQKSSMEYEEYSAISRALTRVSIAYAYLETTAPISSLHVFLAVSGKPVKLYTVYVEGEPMKVSSVTVRSDAGESSSSLPLELGPGVYELVLNGTTPPIPSTASSVAVRLSFDVAVVDCEAMVVRS